LAERDCMDDEVPTMQFSERIAKPRF